MADVKPYCQDKHTIPFTAPETYRGQPICGFHFNELLRAGQMEPGQKMAHHITTGDRDVLLAVVDYSAEHGVPPLYREIGAVVGLSRVGVRRHLHRLIQAGCIEPVPKSMTRCLFLTEKGRLIVQEGDRAFYPPGKRTTPRPGQYMHLDCLTAALIKRNSTLDFPDEEWDVVECSKCRPFVDQAMSAGGKVIS